MQGTVWMNHMEGQAQYAERVLAGVVRVDPMCLWRECLQELSKVNPGCSKNLVRTKQGEARKGGIRGQDHNERKKLFWKREGLTQTGNPLC